MAAAKGNQYALGNSGGKAFGKENREKAATLKGLALDWMMEVMKGNDEELKKLVVLKIASTCIPQEVKHSGNEDNQTPIPILNVFTDNSDKQDNEIIQENTDNSGRNISE
jgi:hypothetical protein